MSILETIAVISGVISVFCTIRQYLICWVFGIISSFLLSIYFLDNKLYGQFLLQMICVIQSIVGWVKWKNNDDTKVKEINLFHVFILLIIGILLGVIFKIIVNPYSLNIWPYLDTIGCCFGLIGTFLLIFKYINSWMFYMINNLIVIIISISYTQMYLVAGLNGLLFVFSIFGIIEWRKRLLSHV